MDNINHYEANIQLWRNCNFNCSFCIGAKLKSIKSWEEHNLKLDVLERFLNETGKWTLNLLGGEVFINPYVGEWCKRLIKRGHKLRFITNGSRYLGEIFNQEELRELHSATFSYHPIHEQNEHYHNIFMDNLRLFKQENVQVDVTYVVTPDRICKLKEIDKLFGSEGVSVSYIPLYGEFENKNYPNAYAEKERLRIREYNKNNIPLLYKLDKSYMHPTYRECRAGYNRFHILLDTGNVSRCEQFSNIHLFNIYKNSAEEFVECIDSTPKKCMARTCICGSYIEMEDFLEKYGYNNISRYEEYKKLCDYNEKAKGYWKKELLLFREYLEHYIQNRDVYIWGGGVHTAQLLDTIQESEMDITICGIVDSDASKAGKEIRNIPIIGKEDLKNRSPQVVLISSKVFEEEIYEQCRELLGEEVTIIKLYNVEKKISVPV